MMPRGVSHAGKLLTQKFFVLADFTQWPGAPSKQAAVAATDNEDRPTNRQLFTVGPTNRPTDRSGRDAKVSGPATALHAMQSSRGSCSRSPVSGSVTGEHSAGEAPRGPRSQRLTRTTWARPRMDQRGTQTTVLHFFSERPHILRQPCCFCL